MHFGTGKSRAMQRTQHSTPSIGTARRDQRDALLTTSATGAIRNLVCCV